MSTSNENAPLLLEYEFPDEGVENNELDWQELKSEPNKRVRDEKIIRRANLYCCLNGARGVSFSGWWGAFNKAKRGTTPNLPFPLE